MLNRLPDAYISNIRSMCAEVYVLVAFYVGVIEDTPYTTLK